MENKKKTPASGRQPVELPGPALDSGRSLLQALRRRQTVRELSSRALPAQVLSNLLWSAWGINRKKGPFNLPGRTAASASDSQEIDLYVLMRDGAYLYEAAAHRLVPAAAVDLRPLALNRGQGAMGAEAPVQLVYVADVNKLANTCGFPEPGLRDPEIQKAYYYVDTGLIAGNVSLFAASSGLAAWFHNCQKPELAQALSLRADQRVLFAHTVGYPEKKRGV
jgi:hypothetical protein